MDEVQVEDRYVARTLEWIPEEFRGGLWTSTPCRRCMLSSRTFYDKLGLTAAVRYL
ncbi:hypothetical protein OE88DRAFT_1533300 [Heliocybe sulcata]|uniref:Uncharacterized protein n=1 Tax=Heliocybe sulcata TaxID=5364 RepID=A0A5C3NBT0_9AGAM|nr:hypothetical protein OE88DRAFT_1533300 [Heliocybe sulcata]